jgi:predicted ATPase/DNA-binding SARP family transcriptional activator
MADVASGLEFRLLGPLEVLRDGRRVELGGTKPRAVLAVLLLNAGRVVSNDRLIEELWGTRPPRTAKAALQGHVSQLRRALGPASETILVTDPGGYRLHVADAQLDVDQFERFVHEARRAADAGDLALARERFTDAVAIWRAPALDGLAFESSAALEAERLNESRLLAVEERIDADLELGHDAELVGELRELVSAHPLRERPRRQLMLALYRSGRQPEALDAYRDARRFLVEELGIEPSRDLRELEHAILVQDPALRNVETSRAKDGGFAPDPWLALGGLTPLVGRARELAELGDLLGRSDVRLVTLTGPGGIGKSRLASAAAERFAKDAGNRPIPVLLAGVSDPDVVSLEIARALGVGEHGAGPIIDRVGRMVADRELLILVDNFEQVLEAAPVLVGLLGSAPRLKLLVTSRAVLHVSGEHVFAVPPLRLPTRAQSNDATAVADCEAVRLFVQRADAQRPGVAIGEHNLADVARICRRLEGVPLALELAAARTRLLAPSALLKHLDERLPMLTGGVRDAPARHQTLTATLDWSFELLEPAARDLFTALGVFPGGFTLDAAQAVCAPDRDEFDLLDTLGALVDHSLLDRDRAADQERFVQLEIIREYACRHLEQRGESDVVCRRHAEYFLALAEAGNRMLEGPEQASSLARLEAEHDNLRAALEWSVTADPQLSLSLAGALRNFWNFIGYVREGERWLLRALDAAGDRPTAARVRALRGAAVLVLHARQDYQNASMLADQALSVCRELHDERLLAESCNVRAFVAEEMGDVQLSRTMFEECIRLARRLDYTWLLMVATHNLGNLAINERDYERASGLCDEALALAERIGDHQLKSLTLCNLATCSLHMGRAADALEQVRAAVHHSRAVGDRWTALICLVCAAATFALTGEIERAARLLASAETLRENMGRHLEAGERELQQRALALVEANRHVPAIGAAWRQGETMSLDDALADVLSSPPSARS